MYSILHLQIILMWFLVTLHMLAVNEFLVLLIILLILLGCKGATII